MTDQMIGHIIGVDIFLERHQTRLYVGRLEKVPEGTGEKLQEKTEDMFRIHYDKGYLKAKNVLSLGPELPLTRSDFFSKALFPSLKDRLPDPDNPAYSRYCAAANIPESTKDPLVLLATVGKRGPSSFIFEPIYQETFTYQDVDKFRKSLGLSLQDFADLFDVSLSVLQKLKAGTTTGTEVLKRLRLYIRFPEVLRYQIRRNAKYLHPLKQGRLLDQVGVVEMEGHP